jgi:hypothetical protein
LPSRLWLPDQRRDAAKVVLVIESSPVEFPFLDQAPDFFFPEIVERKVVVLLVWF